MESKDSITLDTSIFLKGWINLYWKQSILNEDIETLQKLGYQIEEFNCNNWTTNKLHDDFKEKLNFPDYYGRNFNALNDCLYDINIGKGLVFVFRHMDNVEMGTVNILLDIFVRHARQHFVFRRRLLILVQVDDADFKIDPVGAIEIGHMWNQKEWLNSKRK